MHGLTGSRDKIRFAGFELDLRAGELRHQDGNTIRLADQPFQILTMLLERPGEVVTRDEVRMRLWANDTVVEFEHSISAAMNRLRLALGDSADSPRYIETLARRGYRWKTPVQWVRVPSSDSLAPAPAGAPPEAKSPVANVDPSGLATPLPAGSHASAQDATKRRWSSIAAGTLAMAVIAVGTFFYFPRSPKLTEKDSVVLADFANSTGDPVFDGSLREALAAKLDESPYFNVVSDIAIQQTLRLMKQSTGTPLTPDLAREFASAA